MADEPSEDPARVLLSDAGGDLKRNLGMPKAMIGLPSMGTARSGESSTFEGGLSEAPLDAPIQVGGLGPVEIDAKGVPLVMSRPKPLGLLPVPPEVTAVIARENSRLWDEKRIVPTPEALRRMAESFTLQYYYEGLDVAYRRVSQGVEVLAVGHVDIGKLLKGMDQEARKDIKVGRP